MQWNDMNQSCGIPIYYTYIGIPKFENDGVWYGNPGKMEGPLASPNYATRLP